MHALTTATTSRLLTALLVGILGGCCLFPDPPPIISDSGFLGPDDFRGKYRPLPAPIPMGGQSNFSGDAAVTNLSRGIIEDILPSELQLATNTETPSKHPVIVLFGVQHNLKWTFPWGGSIDLDKTYNEIMLIVPFVQMKGKDYWHNWVVRMYLDWPWAVNTGNTYFGLQKELGQFVRSFPTTGSIEYTLDVSRNGTDKWHGSITPVTQWLTDSQANTILDNYPAFKEIFKMPILGRYTSIPLQPWVCSYFDWNMSTGQARHSQVDYSYKSNFVPNMLSWVNLGTIQSENKGGFGLKDLRWRMTTALPCVF